MLANVYTGMCPRAWRSTDANCTDDADLPFRRLEASAANSGLTTELSLEAGHVEH
jgi:hypothetical protein